MTATDTFEFDVFISYRTELLPDKPVAELLQTVLETYPVPAAVKRNIVSPGRFYHRLKVFRDLTDLKASPNLSKAIEEKLRRSRFLIVVCTPNTLGSPYIREEIEKFVRFRGSESVLALLAAGTPEESFPPFMLEKRSDVQSADGTVKEIVERIEPLAANICADTLEGSLKKLKGCGVPLSYQQRFKLLAPVLGCASPDDLVQRHWARIRRHAEYALATIATIAFIIVGLVIERNRQATLKQFFEQVSQLRADEQQVATELDAVIPLPQALDPAKDLPTQKQADDDHRVVAILTRTKALTGTRAQLKEWHRRLFGEVPENISPLGQQPPQLLLAEANALLLAAKSREDLEKCYRHYLQVHDLNNMAPEPLLGMGVAAYRGGDYPSAGGLLEQAAARMAKLRGGDDRETARLVSLAAGAFLKLGDSTHAYELLNRSLVIMLSNWLNTTLELADQNYLIGNYHDALLFADIVKDATNEEDRLTLLRAFAACALNMEMLGHFKEAEEVNRKCIELAEMQFKPDDPSLAMFINNHASVLLSMKRHEKAEQEFQRSKEILAKAGWEKSPSMANVWSNLGRAYRGLRRFTEAHEHARKAIALGTEYYGADHPEVAIFTRFDGHVYEDENAFAEAESCYVTALAIDRKILKGDHPNIAQDLVRLATVRGKLGRRAEAEQLFREALTMAENVFGKDDVQVNDYLEEFARFLQNEQQPKEARQLLSRALRNAESGRSPKHPDVATALADLAEFCMKEGDYEQAVELWTKALNIDKGAYGESNVIVAGRRARLGMGLYQLGRWPDAKVHLEQAATTYEKLLGKDHIDVARTLTALALLIKTNDLNLAESTLRRSLAIHEKVYGPEHTALEDVLFNLAEVLYQSDKIAEAETLARRAIHVRESALGIEDLKLGSFLNLLGMILEKTTGMKAAEREYRRAIEIIERVGSPSHVKLIEPLNNLTILLYDEQRFAEVVPICARTLELVKKSSVDLKTPIYQQIIKQLEEINIKATAKLGPGGA